MTFEKEQFLDKMEATPSTKIAGIEAIYSKIAEDKFVTALQNVLGKATPMFLQGVRNVVADPKNARLAQCVPNTVIRALMECAVTGLSIEPAFGEAAIVPFGTIATFMPMRNGLVKLANNTGNLARLNATVVYEGDIASHNPFTGDYEYNTEPHPRDKEIGYMAYARLLNGHDHYVFWTIEEIQRHGQRYSKNYYSKTGLWQTNFKTMAEKTVLRQLLLHWIPTSRTLNEKLWLALRFDSAVPDSLDVLNATLTYPDLPDGEVQDISDYEDTNE